MTRIPTLRLSFALVASAAIAATALAAPAFAVDPTPAQNAMLLQASDLPSSYGTPADSSFTNVQKGGEYEIACFAADGDNPVSSVADRLNLFSDLDYPSGMSWLQSISVYKSKAQATKAFGQMATKAVPKCQGSFTTTKGDDNITIPARTTKTTAQVKNGIIVSTLKATSKDGGKSPYADGYIRRLMAQVGNAIESLQVDSPKPITAAQKTEQDSTFAKLLARYNG
jgi:hypothetical protein